MSDEEKKNGEYEKPESHEVGGDELEGVAGGASSASASYQNCESGQDGTVSMGNCTLGHSASQCQQGGVAGGICYKGTKG